MKIKICLFFIFISLMFGCTPKHAVKRVSDISEPGFYYSLPKTVFIVRVPVTRSIKSCGIYENESGWRILQDTLQQSNSGGLSAFIGAFPSDKTNYSPLGQSLIKQVKSTLSKESVNDETAVRKKVVEYLDKNNGLVNYKGHCKTEKTYSIGNFQLEEKIEADKSHVYRFEQRGNFQSYTITRNTSGNVTKIDSETKNQLKPILNAALIGYGTAGGPGAAIGAVFGASGSMIANAGLSTDRTKSKQVITSRYNNLQKKQGRSEEERIFLAAYQISQIRAKRLEILTKKYVKDVDQFLENQEKHLLELFFGQTSKTESEYIAEYRPDSDEIKLKDGSDKLTLFSFDKHQGFNLDNNKAVNFTSHIKNQASFVSTESLKDAINYKLSITPHQNRNAFQVGKEPSPDGGDSSVSGYVYRIPVDATIKILKNDSEIFRADKLVNQYGFIARLPNKTGNKSGTYNVQFDESTGFVTTISVTATKDEALTAQQIADTYTARKDARNPTTKLTQEKDRIQAEIDLLNARKELEKLKLE